MSKFNRNYRVLWNKALGQWVVGSELSGSGSKGKTRGAVSRVACAVLVAAGMLGAAPQDAEALVGTGPLAGVCTGIAATIPPGTYNATCTATLTDTLTNNGIITASSSSVIRVDSVSTGVSINNNGVISAGSSAAIFLSRVSTGFPRPAASGTNITNTGVIKANNTTGSATAIDGRTPKNDYTGIIDNSGTISATGSASTGSTSSVKASAIDMFGRSLVGSLLNSGTISATASMNGAAASNLLSVRVSAINFKNVMGGTVSNSGTISAAANNSAAMASSAGNTGSVKAHALDLGAIFSTPAISNTGSITATASNTGTISGGMDLNLDAVAVLARDGFTNSNTISATADNSGGNAAGGMIFNVIAVDASISSTLTNNAAGVISAQLTNTGTIAAVKQINTSSSSKNAFIAGLHASSMGGTLSNAGSITASASVPGHTVQATGLLIDAMNAGTIDNTGTISGTSDSGGINGYSLKVVGGGSSSSSASGNINNLTGGLLQGNISVAGGIAVTNSGTIDLPDGANNASIAGNYTQNAGGILKIGASSATGYAKLSTGPAILIGGTVIDVNVAASNTLAGGDVLTGVLTSTALTAGAISVTDNSSTLDFTVAVNGNSVDLTVVSLGGTPTPTPTTPTTPPASSNVVSNGFFGCSINPKASFDPSMILMLLGAGLALFRRRKEDDVS